MGGVSVYIYSGGWSVMTTPEIILIRMTSNDFELTMIPWSGVSGLIGPNVGQS